MSSVNSYDWWNDWAWERELTMPDLLASTDVIQALREKSEPHSPDPCYGALSIKEMRYLPSGTILGCTERGREFVREMQEAEARKKENGREWMWRSLYGALTGGKDA